MQIAIIGAGNVGAALAQGLIRTGHQVRLGVPDPGKYAALASQLGASVASVTAAIGDAEAVVLAVPYAAAAGVAAAVPDWEGRVLIDATNPIAAGLSGLMVGTHTSNAEEIARTAHNARVVKAFNTTGYENLRNPAYASVGLFMPVAGDDPAARALVIGLAAGLGFDAVDLGHLAAARYLEPLAMVWIEMAFRLGHGRGFGFVRQSAPPR